MTGLVLEGGGMRGLFTCGVLDSLLDNTIHLDYLIGVSAGATNGSSYASRQKERTRVITRRFIRDHRYMGYRNLLKERSYFGMDFMFDAIPKKLVPFDFERFYKEPARFRVGVTDCVTGRCRYYDKEDLDSRLTLLRATCSLPLISPIVQFKGVPLLDGGITDPIPVRQALKDGCEKLVVVLTRDAAYRKEPMGRGAKRLFKVMYRKYPKLVEAMENRHQLYNDTLAYVEELERSGRALVIRPDAPLQSDRLENDPDKLDALYLKGRVLAEARIEEIRRFIGSDESLAL